MKKRTALLVAVILTASLFLLTGCHGKRETAGFRVPEKFDDSRDYTVDFWAKNDSNKAQADIYGKAAEDFQKLYPNIHVNVRLYTEYPAIYNDVITSLSTGTTPGVCVTYPDHIATYKSGGNTVVPLDELIADPKYGLGGSELRFDGPGAGGVVPEYLEECRLDGQYYALPFMRSTEICYVNQDMVEKLGFKLPERLTWDFIWEVSEAAMEKDENGNFKANGQPVLIPFMYKSTDNMMIQYLEQKGAGYSNDMGDVLIFNDVTSGFLREIHKHAASRAFSTFKVSGYPGNFMNAGQCIFAIDSSGGATWMGPDAPNQDIAPENKVNFRIAVRAIPQADWSKPKMISQGPSICLFNRDDPQEVLAAWLFMQYMLTNDVQISYSETEGYVPVTLKAREADGYRDYLARKGEDNGLHYITKIEAAETLLRHTRDTFVTPVFNGSTALRSAAEQLIENVTKGARRKQEMSDEYLKQQYAEVGSLYKLDQIGGAEGKTDDAGELPEASKILLITLAGGWFLLAVWGVISGIRRARAKREKDKFGLDG